MIFDQVCSVVESHMPPLSDLMRKVKIFSFPYKAQDILPNVLDQKEADYLRDNFFLPFQHVAIEDSASCTLVWDDKPEAKGSRVPRHFIDCMELSTGISEFGDDSQDKTTEQEYKQFQKIFPEAVLISGGIVDYMIAIPEDTEHGFQIRGHVAWSTLASKQQIYYSQEGSEIKRQYVEAVLRNARVALSEIFYFNNPSRFVMETKTVKQPHKPKKKNRNRLARSRHRPLYTLLTPKEIREKFDIKEPEGEKRDSPDPHHRRRHSRTYPDDPNKWPKAHGKTIIIPAKWIGPSEVIKDGKRYKVRLDL